LDIELNATECLGDVLHTRRPDHLPRVDVGYARTAAQEREQAPRDDSRQQDRQHPHERRDTAGGFRSAVIGSLRACRVRDVLRLRIDNLGGARRRRADARQHAPERARDRIHDPVPLSEEKARQPGDVSRSRRQILAEISQDERAGELENGGDTGRLDASVVRERRGIVGIGDINGHCRHSSPPSPAQRGPAPPGTAPGICLETENPAKGKDTIHKKINRAQSDWGHEWKRGLSLKPTEPGYRSGPPKRSDVRAESKNQLKDPGGLTEAEAECVMLIVDKYLDSVNITEATTLKTPYA